MFARRPVSEWLQRPRAWAAVIGASTMIMTMFLWHLTALMVVGIALLPAGFPQPEVGTAGWWLLWPVWLAILCVVTALFVLLLGRFERPGQKGRFTQAALLQRPQSQ